MIFSGPGARPAERLFYKINRRITAARPAIKDRTLGFDNVDICFLQKKTYGKAIEAGNALYTVQLSR